ncbi:ABC transporter B family member 21-like protein [Tanacetum coccineum]
MLMFVDTVGAVVNGVCTRLITLLFGDLINSLGDTKNNNDVVKVVSKMVTGERQAARTRNLYLKSILRQDISYFDKERSTGEPGYVQVTYDVSENGNTRRLKYTTFQMHVKASKSKSEYYLSGMLYTMLQKELLTLQKPCHQKDQNIKDKDSTIEIRRLFLFILIKTKEVESKRTRRELNAMDKELSALRADIQHEVILNDIPVFSGVFRSRLHINMGDDRMMLASSKGDEDGIISVR